MKNRWRLLYLCALAWCGLCGYKLLIFCVPFRWWSSLCGHARCESLKTGVQCNKMPLNTIQRAVYVAARFVPFRSQCFEKALVAQQFLKKYRLPNTLYLGMMKQSEHWVAHAWLRCGTAWVMGYDPCQQYTVVGTYAQLYEVVSA